MVKAKQTVRLKENVKNRVSISTIFLVPTMKYTISMAIIVLFTSFVYIGLYKSTIEMNAKIYEITKENKSISAKIQKLENDVNKALSHTNIEKKALELGLIYANKN